MGHFKLGHLKFQHIIFSFFVVNLGPSRKIVGQIRGLLSYFSVGLPWAPGNLLPKGEGTSPKVRGPVKLLSHLEQTLTP